MDEPKKSLMKTYHIIFDVTNAPKELLSDYHFVFNLLVEIPDLVGMKILSGPNLVKDYDPNNLGISGFAIISFSHISVHTFSSEGQALVDVFSCKPYDYEKVRKYLYEKFQVNEDQVCTLEVKYPWENNA